MRDLNGNVVIVTGSSSGIGEAAARAFAAEGCRVVVNSSSSVEAGEKVAAALPDAIYVQGDVSREADCDALVAAAIERWGRLDVLVNNAGTTKVIPHRDIQAAGEDVWRRILDVNVIGTWLMSRAAAKALAAGDGGSIINVSSVAGSRPSGSSIPYACSKAAVNHMTRLLAKVLGPEVRVNAVAPGLVDTPWTADWDTPKANTAKMAPLRRVGTVDDVAHVCVFLAQADYTTGEVVTSDGGVQLGI
jgi:ketoreductase RED2